MTIEAADPIESELLTRIMRLSKAHWGYSTEQLNAWESELVVSEKDFEGGEVYKASQDDEIFGFYSFYQFDSETVKLENLFILPKCIGKGLGKSLLEDFEIRVREKGYTKVTLDADPNAMNFYLSQGYIVTGEKETSIKNRFMPVMEKLL